MHISLEWLLLCIVVQKYQMVQPPAVPSLALLSSHWHFWVICCPKQAFASSIGTCNKNVTLFEIASCYTVGINCTWLQALTSIMGPALVPNLVLQRYPCQTPPLPHPYGQQATTLHGHHCFQESGTASGPHHGHSAWTTWVHPQTNRPFFNFNAEIVRCWWLITS